MTQSKNVDNYVEIGDFFFESPFYGTMQEIIHGLACKTTFIFARGVMGLMSTGFLNIVML